MKFKPFVLGAAFLTLFGWTQAHPQKDGATPPRISPKVEKQLLQREKALEAASQAAKRAAEAKPAEAKPAEAKPAEVKPAETKPAAAKPAAPNKTLNTPVKAAPAGAQEARAETSPAKPWRPRPWRSEAEAALKARLALKPIEGRARNVILMIGDGMGVATATAARLHVNQRNGGLGEESLLAHERFPYSALTQTYTVNAQTGDGAATATALMAGEKTRSGVLGLDQTAVRGRCGSGVPLPRIGDLFKKDGRAVGYVTTARLTHATPAAGYATSVDRLWEHDGRMPADCLQKDIAQQLANRIGAGEVDLALGGGRAMFTSAEARSGEGARQDGRDLIAEAVGKGARYVASGSELKALDPAGDGPILGLFASGSMSYEHDRETLEKDEPSLAEMAGKAIAALEAASGGKGYFLMIEGGRIGQASHYGALHHVLRDSAAFAEAVAKVLESTDRSDTLVLVTADVAHSLSFNGYCGRGSPVPGLCYAIAPEGGRHADAPARDATGALYETTGFLNGPGAERGASGNAPLNAASARDPLRRQRALVPMETETTSAADAPAYAIGPWAHLLGGVVDQHFLFQIMRHAAFAEAEAAPAAKVTGQ